MTPQDIIDTVKTRWDIQDTSLDSIMLGWLNRSIWPKVRNTAIQANKKYFNEIAYIDLVAGVSTYQPTDDDEAAIRIREIHAVHVLLQEGSQNYQPLVNAELERNDVVQVNSDNTSSVWGFMMEGASIRVVDIPRTSITNGIRLDYTPQLTVFTLSTTIPLADDFADPLVDGVAMCLAERKKDAEMISHFTRQFAISMNDFRSAVAQRVDEPINFESGAPETD